MKCVTYGVIVFLMLLLTIILMPLGFISPSLAISVYSFVSLFFLVWWIMGFFSDCDGGYLLTNLRKVKPEKYTMPSYPQTGEYVTLPTKQQPPPL